MRVCCKRTILPGAKGPCCPLRLHSHRPSVSIQVYPCLNSGLDEITVKTVRFTRQELTSDQPPPDSLNRLIKQAGGAQQEGLQGNKLLF